MNTVASPEADTLEQLKQTVSASRLSCWSKCRLQFYYRYVLKLTKPPTAALHLGSVVHLVLQAWNMARWKRQPFNVEVYRSVFDVGWKDQPEQINWDGEEEGQRQTAWTMLEKYFIETPIKSNELPEAVEVPVEADLGSYGLPVLRGVLDLVRAGGKIVDFKTSARTPNNEDAKHQNQIQLSSYSILYREATGKRESGRELHHLVKLKSPKIIVTPVEPMTDHEQSRLFRQMESYVNGLDKQDFVPSVGMHCMSCEFFNECKKWG
jgi:CRISPR/Cas system-associated exonuclease Cas4 (RecB family)